MKAALALGVYSEWLRTGEVVSVHEGSTMVYTEDLRRALRVAESGGPGTTYFPDDHRVFLESTFRAVDGYLALLHQQLPLDQRIKLAGALITRCQEIGLKDPETLSLEALHETLSSVVFP